MGQQACEANRKKCCDGGPHSPWSSMERRSRLYVNVVWVNVSITARGRLGLDSPRSHRHTEGQTKTKTTDTHRDRQRQRQREANTQQRYTDPDKEWQGWSKYRRWLTIMRKGEKNTVGALPLLKYRTSLAEILLLISLDLI